MTTCPHCAHEFNIPTFQFWSGRCPQCDRAMTQSTRQEDRENAERPPVTSEEFLEFLKYTDDLALMRLRGDEAKQLAAIFLVGGFLWAFGIGTHLVEFEFGIFYALCVGVTFASVFWWKLRSRCPRCKQTFGPPMGHSTSTRFPGFRLRLTLNATAEACGHCGLQSLSQYDIRRFLEERGLDIKLQKELEPAEQ